MPLDESFRSAALVLSLAWLLAGCDRESERMLKDTEGRTFAALCDKNGCVLTRKSGEPVSASKSAVGLSTAGRLVAVCDVPEGGERVEPADCRPLECDGDNQCPVLHGMKDGVCINGLCTEPANSLNREDVILLCLAGTGLGRETPSQVERYAMALNCGEPCRVPSPCRKP
jgi:hypothetical protein